ncbi:MAG: hypothetical protein VKJ46_14275 [Leptolyngbyaceae bacterium]|nr:hypothetical protein [Leptolyngbyaceae bacterium]
MRFEIMDEQVLTIKLPEGISKPKFSFWQRVRVEDEEDYGVITGMEFVRIARREGDEGWWYQVEIEREQNQCRVTPVVEVRETDLVLAE